MTFRAGGSCLAFSKDGSRLPKSLGDAGQQGLRKDEIRGAVAFGRADPVRAAAALASRGALPGGDGLWLWLWLWEGSQRAGLRLEAETSSGAGKGRSGAWLGAEVRLAPAGDRRPLWPL